MSVPVVLFAPSLCLRAFISLCWYRILAANPVMNNPMGLALATREILESQGPIPRGLPFRCQCDSAADLVRHTIKPLSWDLIFVSCCRCVVFVFVFLFFLILVEFVFGADSFDRHVCPHFLVLCTGGSG